MQISYEITCLPNGKYRLRRLSGTEPSLVGPLSRTDLEIYLVNSLSARNAHGDWHPDDYHGQEAMVCDLSLQEENRIARDKLKMRLI